MKILLILALVVIIVYFYFKVRNRVSPKGIYIDEQAGTSKPRVRKGNKTWGKFYVTGYQHLPEDVKKIVWKELKVGDELKFLPDTFNKYDKNAIKVMFQDKQIGWFPKEHDRKTEVFQALINGRDFKVICTGNVRRQETNRAYRPDKDGNYNDKYFMAQFVQGKYEYEI